MPRKRLELTGKRFGRLTVTEYAGYGTNGRQRVSEWKCRCDCGRDCIVAGYLLQSGRRKSCGCIRVASQNLIGMRFGKLTVVGEDTEDSTTLRKVICVCDCGTRKSIAFRELKKGRIISCGCDSIKNTPKQDFFEKSYDAGLESKKAAFLRGDISKIQTLEDWVYVWTREVLPNVVKSTTCLMYGETMARHILPYLGGKALHELTASVVRDWVAGLRNTQIPGTMQGYMTDGTVRNTLSVLSGCLRDAQKYGLLEENPCLDAAWRLPCKNVSEKHEWLDQGQISRLEPLIMEYRDKQGYPVGIGFQLILFAGLTMSEAVALRWEDVELDQKMLHVRYFAAVVKTSRDRPVNSGISLEKAIGRKRRDIPISDRLVNRLTRLYRDTEGRKEDFVMCPSSREPVSMDYMRAVLLRSSQAAGIGRVTPRMLRDTYAIYAVKAGATSDMIAELMGFASSQQVVRRYMPKEVSDKRDLVNQMYDC